MNQMLILLVLLWAVLLVPSAWRSRSASSPHVTVEGFERAMDVLRSSPARSGKVGSRSLLVPDDAQRIVDHADLPAAEAPTSAPRHREAPAIEARRQWFVRALLASLVALVMAPVLGGAAWVVASLTWGATAAYAVLLRRWKLQRDEVRTVVRELGSVRPAPAAASDDERPRVAVGAEAPGTVRLRRWDG